jgi:hypothetical protein
MLPVQRVPILFPTVLQWKEVIRASGIISYLIKQVITYLAYPSLIANGCSDYRVLRILEASVYWVLLHRLHSEGR